MGRDGDASAKTTNIFNINCLRIGKVSIGCDASAVDSGQNGTDGGDTQQQSYGGGTAGQPASTGMSYKAYACGEEAYRMACPSIAVSGTNCRRCQ